MDSKEVFALLKRDFKRPLCKIATTGWTERTIDSKRKEGRLASDSVSLTFITIKIKNYLILARLELRIIS